jgi:hypothetical protein
MPAFFVYLFRLLPARHAVVLAHGRLVASLSFDTQASGKLRNASEACDTVNDETTVGHTPSAISTRQVSLFFRYPAKSERIISLSRRATAVVRGKFGPPPSTELARVGDFPGTISSFSRLKFSTLKITKNLLIFIKTDSFITLLKQPSANSLHADSQGIPLNRAHLHAAA